MFTNHDESFEDYFYYFSPGATRIAGALILSCSGFPCEPPTRQSVALLAGETSKYLFLDQFIQ